MIFGIKVSKVIIFLFQNIW